jgi:hypothetical protein
LLLIVWRRWFGKEEALRKKTFVVKEDAGSSKQISAEMEDEYHQMEIHIWVNIDTLRIERVELDMSRHPESTCLDCKGNLEKLVGRNFQDQNFRWMLLKTIGGERGCFHVFELLAEAHDYARAHFWERSPDRRGHFRIPRIDQEGRVECIAYKKE